MNIMMIELFNAWRLSSEESGSRGSNFWMYPKPQDQSWSSKPKSNQGDYLTRHLIFNKFPWEDLGFDPWGWTGSHGLFIEQKESVNRVFVNLFPKITLKKASKRA